MSPMSVVVRLNPVRLVKAGMFRTIRYTGVCIISWLVTAVLCVMLIVAYMQPELRDQLWSKNLWLAFGAIGLNLFLYRWSMIAVNAVLLFIAFSLI
jgi:hypothetical protein